jgi:hypothetical protein
MPVVVVAPRYARLSAVGHVVQAPIELGLLAAVAVVAAPHFGGGAAPFDCRL